MKTIREVIITAVDSHTAPRARLGSDVYGDFYNAGLELDRLDAKHPDYLTTYAKWRGFQRELVEMCKREFPKTVTLSDKLGVRWNDAGGRLDTIQLVPAWEIVMGEAEEGQHTQEGNDQ